MTLAALRDRASVPLEWTAAYIAARPKTALAVWIVSLVCAAWVF